MKRKSTYILTFLTGALLPPIVGTFLVMLLTNQDQPIWVPLITPFVVPYLFLAAFIVAASTLSFDLGVTSAVLDIVDSTPPLPLRHIAYREAESTANSWPLPGSPSRCPCVLCSGRLHRTAQTRGRRHRLLTVALVIIAVESAFCTHSGGTGIPFRIQSSCMTA